MTNGDHYRLNTGDIKITKIFWSIHTERVTARQASWLFLFKWYTYNASCGSCRLEFLNCTFFLTSVLDINCLIVSVCHDAWRVLCEWTMVLTGNDENKAKYRGIYNLQQANYLSAYVDALSARDCNYSPYITHAYIIFNYWIRQIPQSPHASFFPRFTITKVHC
jgi:hypothetical protein